MNILFQLLYSAALNFPLVLFYTFYSCIFWSVDRLYLIVQDGSPSFLKHGYNSCFNVFV